MDARHQLAHLQVVAPADIPCFKSLEVHANCQTLWAPPDSDLAPLISPMPGPDRCATEVHRQLSKMFLLLDDMNITDSLILEQIQRSG